MISKLPDMIKKLISHWGALAKFDNSFDSGRESGYTQSAVKTRRHSTVKQMEARARSVVKASRGTSKAAAQQRRVSMAGGVKWEITNWRQVAGAFAKWA